MNELSANDVLDIIGSLVQHFREEPPEPDEYEIDELEYNQQEYENLELDDQEFDEMLMKVLEKHHTDEISDYKISQLDDNGWY